MGFMTLRHMGKPLGATFIGISILVLMIGVNRFVVRRFLLFPQAPRPALEGGVNGLIWSVIIVDTTNHRVG